MLVVDPLLLIVFVLVFNAEDCKTESSYWYLKAGQR